MAGGADGEPDIEGTTQALRHQEALGQSRQHDPGAAPHGRPHQCRARLIHGLGSPPPHRPSAPPPSSHQPRVPGPVRASALRIARPELSTSRPPRRSLPAEFLLIISSVVQCTPGPFPNPPGPDTPIPRALP
jgi:hypothetical protein